MSGAGPSRAQAALLGVVSMAGQSPWNFDQYDQSKSSSGPAATPSWTPSGQSTAGVDTGQIDFGFTSSPAGSAELEVGRPPLIWLAGAGVGAATGIILGALSGDSPALAFAGWLI